MMVSVGNTWVYRSTEHLTNKFRFVATEMVGTVHPVRIANPNVALIGYLDSPRGITWYYLY
jgi:hypothetical protein